MRNQLLLFAFWLCSNLSSYDGFLHLSHYSRLSSRIAVSNDFRGDFPSLSEMCQTVVVPLNTTATLINLIQFGDVWASENNGVAEGKFARFKKGERVPGCMADVRITTSFKYPVNNEIEGVQADYATNLIWPTVCIDGSADSRVAQGILALLCKGLNERSCFTVLKLSPSELSKNCGLHTLLPVGRLNGLHNMVTVIHNQISREMQKSKEQRNNLKGNIQRKSAEFQSNSFMTDKTQSSGDVMRDSSIIGEVEQRDTSDEVAVLLSGGVDSSVALKLLQLQGHKVRAFYLKIWLEDEVAHLNECPWEEDLQYAEDVCHQLGVPLETLSLQKEYWQEVVQYTFKEAREGRTPNPDMLCNSRIKFGMFYEYVGKHYSKIATGHYAQVLYGDDSVEEYSRTNFARNDEGVKASSIIEIGDDDSVDVDRNSHDSNEYTKLILDRNKDISPKEIEKLPIPLNITSPAPSHKSMKARLVMSPDAVKDQTYFLSALSQEQLSKAMFPIGHLAKPEVRALAEKYQLPTRGRKDSQGICFLGKLKFDEFIEHYLGAQEGSIRCYQTGKVLGQHRGLWFHTIGQRKGLGPHLVSVVHNGPWYVAAKEAESNTLYVTNNLEVIDRPRVEFRVHKINWVSGIEPEGLDGEGIVMNFKLRHGPTLSRGRVFRDKLHSNFFSTDKEKVEEDSPLGTESKGSILRVILDVKDKGIAPGQFAAFYKDSECLGAGIIADTAVDEIHRQEEHLTAVKIKKSFSSQN